jgi:hypothetical protein
MNKEKQNLVADMKAASAAFAQVDRGKERRRLLSEWEKTVKEIDRLEALKLKRANIDPLILELINEDHAEKIQEDLRELYLELSILRQELEAFDVVK